MSSRLIVNSIRHTGASGDAVTLANDGTCTANITNNLSNRNIIINGAAQVNQRGTQTDKTSSTYFVDRFRLAFGNAGTWTLSQSTDSPDGFGSSMKLDCITAKSPLAADSYILLQQKIEGQNVQAFAKGTSAAKQFAVSFYMKSNVSGTYTAEVQDNDNNRIASKTFTVSDGNWNRYSLIFPADTTGTFNNDNAQSMSINIWLVGGVNYTSGTLNTTSWATKANANRVSSSNVNVASSTSNELYFTGVQLEVGGVVTEYENRSYAEELALCQRYYYRHAQGAAGRNIGIAALYGDNNLFPVIHFPCTMRTTPSLDVSDGSGYFRVYSNGSSDGFDTFSSLWNTGDNAVGVNAYSNDGISGRSAGQSAMVITDHASAHISFSAEL